MTTTKKRRHLKLYSILLSALSLIPFIFAQASAAPSCNTVRFSNVGWTDIAATTATTSLVLQGLGYQTETQMLSIPVTLRSLANKDIDVFLGDWTPSMDQDIAPYTKAGTVDTIQTNLTGAKFTLAVPQYVYDAGVHSIADLTQFADKFQHQIYAIEPGNSGNELIWDMLNDNAYQLKEANFTVNESSEAGMLSQLKRAVQRKQWIVFLGWAPHPMNSNFDIQYLRGGEKYFGPNMGAGKVLTNTRAGYVQTCPNVGSFLKNLKFTMPMENQMMDLILNHGKKPEQAAQSWLQKNPEILAKWLDGITTIDGKPGLPAVRNYLGINADGSIRASAESAADNSLFGFVTAHKIPFGHWMEIIFDWLSTHAGVIFDGIAFGLGWLISSLVELFTWFHPIIIIAATAALAYTLHRRWLLVTFCVLALAFIWNLGYWNEMIQTFVLVFIATLLSVVLAVPIGIFAAHKPKVYLYLRPILDLMQTVPTFVYLIPTLVLFGLGVVPGLISTIIFSIAAPIRLTYLGIRKVPEELVEAGKAFGATPMKLLFKVELPAAMSSIMAGVTQCIMLSLSMVVISAMVGANGLGKPVVQALNTVNISQGFEAGLCIVLVAMILDRICKQPSSSDKEES